MRRALLGWVLVLAAAGISCTLRPAVPTFGSVAGERSPWVGRPRRTSPLLVAVRQRPELGDLVRYLDARAAARAGDDVTAVNHVAALGAEDPESIWLPSARLLAGQLRRRAGDLEGARGWLLAARGALSAGGSRWTTATLALGDVLHRLGDDAEALQLARAVRSTDPPRIAARRAWRLTERIRRRAPDLFVSVPSQLAEAELALSDGNAAAAALAATAVLGTTPPSDDVGAALWIRARAERALGDRAAAEVTCLEIARTPSPLGPKALAAAARWRWNADDDAGALRLYRQLATRFTGAPEGVEARYAIGRIQQEAGQYDAAFATYDRLAREQPKASVATEARFRAGWVRYLAGDLAGAAAYLAEVASSGPAGIRPAAAYWRARILASLRDPTADLAFEALLSEHPSSYYAGLAAERLGRSVAEEPTAVVAPPAIPFPDGLPEPHGGRARALTDLGFFHLARRELDAVRDDTPSLVLAQAYTAVDAPGAALQSVRGLGPNADDEARRFLYPLGFWPVVERESTGRGLDPLLVASLIRQESLFLPEAVSPADAHGLMQLLPRTARDVAAAAGVTAIDVRALHVVPTNVQLGTTLLRRLLDKYQGSRAKALAAYNAGEDAVAKWERRYGAVPDDEFTELISYRETRDYVKLVLGNLQTYRQLYAASALATSPGSPPKAPFDMITITSPGTLVATR